MLRYFAVCEYDGFNYHGWARQKTAVTVQSTIDKCLTKLLKCDVKTHGSGRTDAGVHALNQVFHFDVDFEIKEIPKFIKGLNTCLSPNIKIKKLSKAPTDFHAQYSVLEKTYLYKISFKKLSVFEEKYFAFHSSVLDKNKMQTAMNIFIGKYNFLSFSEDERINELIRDIKVFNIYKFNKNYLFIKITANGFLRYMIRKIISCCIDFCEDKITIVEIKNLLKNPKKGAYTKKMVPQGLYLSKVKY